MCDSILERNVQHVFLQKRLLSTYNRLSKAHEVFSKSTFYNSMVVNYTPSGNVAVKLSLASKQGFLNEA